MKTVEPILQFFEFKHLPENLQGISGPVCVLAESLDRKISRCPEKSAGLRKLLEAKDCFVRVVMQGEKTPDVPTPQGPIYPK